MAFACQDWGVSFTSEFSISSVIAGWIAGWIVKVLFMLFFAYIAVYHTEHS